MYWGRRSKAQRSEASSDFPEWCQKVKEGEVTEASRHRAEAAPPQNKSWRVGISQHQLLFQPNVHLRPHTNHQYTAAKPMYVICQGNRILRFSDSVKLGIFLQQLHSNQHCVSYRAFEHGFVRLKAVWPLLPLMPFSPYGRDVSTHSIPRFCHQN